MDENNITYNYEQRYDHIPKLPPALKLIPKLDIIQVQKNIFILYQ